MDRIFDLRYGSAMLASMKTRQREAEWLDEPDIDPVALDKSLAYIRKVNRLLGYTEVILRHLARFSKGWEKGQAIRLIDIGTGSADIPIAILEWADAQGFDIRVVGVDLNPAVVRRATAASDDPRLTIVQADALALPFEAGSFDYALTSMFLHHLSDGDAERALAEMGRVSSRGIIASDLLRLRASYAGIWLLTLFASPMVKHDARVSVRQSFSGTEIVAISRRAGLDFAGYFVHRWHRFVLAGEKPGRDEMASQETSALRQNAGTASHAD